MPDEVVVRPSTTSRMNFRRSCVMPMAVRGWRARMSARSGKQLESVALGQVTCVPSVTISGKPLTSDRTPGGSASV